MDPTEYPGIKSWAAGFNGDLDYFDFAVSRLEFSDWLAVARIFRPDFIEVEGCVLWKRAYSPPNFRQWRELLGEDRSSIEATLNRLALWRLVEWPQDETSERAAHGLAQDISLCWRAALSTAFPDREFEVCATSTEDGPVVSFVTVR